MRNGQNICHNYVCLVICPFAFAVFQITSGQWSQEVTTGQIVTSPQWVTPLTSQQQHVNKTADYDFVPSPTECNFITGSHQEDACQYLHRLFPSKHRIPKPTAAEMHTPLLLPDVLMPLCFLSFPNVGTSNSRYTFGNSSQTGIYYNPTPDKRAFSTPSLHSKDGKSLSAVLWLQMESSKPSVEIKIEEEELNAGWGGDQAEPNKYLSKEMLSRHLWPSGDFIYTNNGDFAVTHQGSYDVGVFKREGDTYTKINTSGFKDAGGENIGSLFQFNDKIYASVRVNLRYHLRSDGGHGYRYAGVYHVSLENVSRTEATSHGSLVVQHANDAECCAACGGCAEDKLFARTCKVDSDAWWDCLSVPSNTVARTWSLTKQMDCQLKASLQLTDIPCDFSAYYICVHKCRARSEVYHSAVSNIAGGLFGLISFRDDNSVRACRLGAQSMTFFCFDTPVRFLKNSLPSHPIMSKIVETRNKFTFLETVTTDYHKPDPSKPTAIAHSWERENFCSLTQENPSLPGSVTVRIRLEGTLHIVFSPVSSLLKSCRYTCLSLDTSVAIGITYRGRAMRKIKSNKVVQYATGNAGVCLCSKGFVLDDKCKTKICDAQISLNTVKIHGIYSGTSAWS